MAKLQVTIDPLPMDKNLVTLPSGDVVSVCRIRLIMFGSAYGKNGLEGCIIYWFGEEKAHLIQAPGDVGAMREIRDRISTHVDSRISTGSSETPEPS